jgi:Rod binding domain-containing protein
MDMMNISSLSQYASDIASNKATDELKNKASAAQTDDELLSACKEFESYLWEQVLNSMKKTAEVFKDEKESNSQMVDYFMDSAVSDVASQMTEQTSSSKNSLAMQMYEQMKRTNTIDIEKLFAENDSEN